MTNVTMRGLSFVTDPLLPAAMALGIAALLLSLDRRAPAAGRSMPGHAMRGTAFFDELLLLVPLVPLASLAGAVAVAPQAGLEWPALAVALLVATLARMRQDLLHSECAIKLLWVMGTALALSWAGFELLVLATGTSFQVEQWGVLALGLDPDFLWSTALPLSLLVGLVFLGGAPFHFWAADLFQGAKPGLAPLAVAALQVCGAGWLTSRLVGIEGFPPAARLIETLLGTAAQIAFLVGAATLIAQRRPERRVGTLASLNGALILAALATAHHGDVSRDPPAALVGLWAGHLVLALTGAATLARFLPISVPVAAGPPVMFRRHPWSGVIGLFALFSLAGVPGTPGAFLWLAVARDLVATGQTWLVIALVIAWLSAFSAAVKQLREAIGVRTEEPAPTQPVPWQARVAMWAAGVTLAVYGYAAAWR